MKRVACLPVVMAFLVAAAFATTIRPMSVEELTQTATDVVEARALQSWSQWDANHTRISTYTRFQITRKLKGLGPATFVVRQMGGSAGGYTQTVAGVRYWQPGEESVLFLRPSVEEAGMMAVVGLIQGNFRIVRTASGEAHASNGVAGVSAVTADGRNIGAFTGSGMRLTDLEKLVLRGGR